MKAVIQWLLNWWFQRPKPALTAWHAQQMMKTSKDLFKAVEERIEEEARAGFGFALLPEFTDKEIAEIKEEFEKREFVVEPGLIRWL